MILKYLNLFLQTVISMPSISSETAYHRDYFYVGGGYAGNGKGEHIFKSQMYVEHLVPVGGSRRQHPLLLMHGSAQTGTNWLNKPDGGRGWASYFIDQGYECYIVDQTYRGRSPSFTGSGDRYELSAEQLEKFFTAPRKHKLWPEAQLHTQWPGSGVMGDPIFDTYYASTVPSLGDQSAQEYSIQAAGAALLGRIGRPVILVSHSQAGSQGWVIADARPELVHSMVTMEPSGPPFEDYLIGDGPARPWGLAEIPVEYSPPVSDPQSDLAKKIIPANSTVPRCIIQADDPPARQLTNLSRVKMLVVTAEASYHRPTDWCTVTYLRQAGVSVDHIQLGDIGVHGNGHMMFLEKNSDQVAAVLQDWIEGGQQA